MSSILPKNEWKQFDLICHSTEGRIFSFFLEEFRIPTSPFEITWPLHTETKQLKGVETTLQLWKFRIFPEHNLCSISQGRRNIFDHGEEWSFRNGPSSLLPHPSNQITYIPMMFIIPTLILQKNPKHKQAFKKL